MTDEDGLKRMLRMAQRALARADPETYIELITGRELAAHHKLMLDFARDIVENKKRGVILAPRGAAKTTILNTGHNSWLVGTRPDIRIGLFSQKDSKAEAMSSAIQGIIDYSEDFKAIFGDLHGPKWTATEWLRKGSPHVKTNNRTMVTGGAGQSSTAVSKRFDLLFFDDILDQDNTATIDQREKIETWFWKSMMPTQAAEGAAVLVVGCLDRSTPVLMADGTWKRIDSVEVGESVWSVDETGTSGPRTVEASLDQGEAEVLAVRTAKTEVLATPWHPFLVARDGGLVWVRADELRDGDFLVESKEIPGVNEHPWADESFMWLLGFLFGDGWVGSSHSYVACALGSDEDMNRRVLHGLGAWFPTVNFYLTPFGYVRCDSPAVARALAELGLDGNAKTKRVPDWVLRSTPEMRRAFLSGFCDADGHWMQRSTRTARIELANGDLVRDLWHLALTCGVRPTAITHRSRVSQPPRSREAIESHSWATSLNFATVGALEYAPNGNISKAVKPIEYGARLSSMMLGPSSRLVRFVSAAPAGRRHVWDLTVEGTHAFIADGLAVHNTRWVEDDLYQRLIDDNKWPHLIIPAITVDEETGADVSYWPEVWPLDRLYTERDDVGWDNFACSYLNDISGLREGTIFRREWWRDAYFDELPADRTYVFTIGIDLASSLKERADYTAGVVTAFDSRGEHWVLHHDRIKTDTGHRAFVRSLYDWAAVRGYRVSRILIENNQSQESVVAQIKLDEPDLPIVGRRTDTDKVSRARGAASRYESRRVHHHADIKGRELETELLGFPKGHDDLVDALGLSMDLGSVSGSIAVVKGRERAPEDATAHPELGTEVIFRDGPRNIPAYLAGMMQGLPVDMMTYDEAVAACNRHQLTGYIKGILGGMRR